MPDIISTLRSSQVGGSIILSFLPGVDNLNIYAPSNAIYRFYTLTSGDGKLETSNFIKLATSSGRAGSVQYTIFVSIWHSMKIIGGPRSDFFHK